MLQHGSILHSFLWQINIPPCGQTMFCLSIYLLMNICCCHLWAIMGDLCTSICQNTYFHRGVKLLGHMVTLMFKVSESVSCSVVSNSVTPWTVASQAPLSMESSSQEYWGGQPFPSPGDFPDPGIEPGSPALYVDSVPSEPPGKPNFMLHPVTLYTTQVNPIFIKLVHLDPWFLTWALYWNSLWSFKSSGTWFHSGKF